MNQRFILALLLISCCTGEGYAQYYFLFHPVPKAALQDLETDRPNVTESPYTVDAGHFQYETDLVLYERVKTTDATENTVTINQANLKVGIARNTAIQINWETYTHQVVTVRTTHEKTISHGTGNLTLRLKQNILGNDQGKWALAVLPYVIFPVAGYEDDQRYEYGILVPVQVKLAGDWKLGFQSEADELRDDESQGRHLQLLQTLAVSHPVIKDLDILAETHVTYDVKHHEWQNFLNAAVQWEVTKSILPDTGVNYGLQSAAPRNVFIGFSYRL